MKSNAIIMTNGKLHLSDAKTAHGLIRGTDRYNIIGIIDPINAGKDAGEVLDGQNRNIPIYNSIQESIEKNTLKIEHCIIGIATPGGILPPDLRSSIKEAIAQKISIVNGLHEYLSDMPEIVHLAKENQVELKDIRKPRPTSALQFWSGKIKEVKCPKIAVLGTDCSVGKRTTSRFLMEECKTKGLHAEMIYTGQTGWLQGGKYGFIFDSTVNDFISGEIEHAIHTCYTESRPDIIFVEGQSSLRNPSGPCGSEFLISGEMDGVILQHRPTQTYFHDHKPWGKIPSVKTEIELIRLYGVETLALTLNTTGISKSEALTFKQQYEEALGIPVFIPLQQEVEKIVEVLIDKFKL